MIGTTIVVTVLHCPTVPSIVGQQYTFTTDIDGRYMVTGLPRDTAITIRVKAVNPVERQLTIGDSPYDIDMVIEGPACLHTTVCPAAIRGSVFDASGRPLDGVTITARIDTAEVLGDRRFDATGSDTEVTTTVAGAFTIEDAPTGAMIRISASKPGYVTRQKTIIPVSNQAELAGANDLAFGKDLRTGALDPGSALVAEPPVASPSPKGG